MEAKKGDKVEVHYTGKLLNGTVFDSSIPRNQTLPFEVGAGQMIAGFDAAIPGMKVGDKKTIEIPPMEAYGEKDPLAIIAFSKANVPADVTLEIGQQLTLTNEHGQPVPVVVLEIKEEEIIMDANHSLAGETLVFEIELVKIGSGIIMS